MKHVYEPGVECPLCESKLNDAHETLRGAFKLIKFKFPDVHISCTYRSKEEQDIAWSQGRSKARWPSSKHNCKPARAMDLFKLRADKVPAWPLEYFRQIADYLVEMKAGIFWGGRFQSFIDGPHFEIPLDAD